jgi:hypothetical protein
MVKSGTNNLLNSFHFQTLNIEDEYLTWSGPEKEKIIVLTCTPAAYLFWLDRPKSLAGTWQQWQAMKQSFN